MTRSSCWWTFVVRGALAIVFAVLALVIPAAALAALIWLFGIFAGVSGVMSIAAGLAGGTHRHSRWAYWLQGFLGIGVAVFTFARPALTGLALLYIIGAWALLTGVLELLIAARLRHQRHGEWRLALAGVVSVVFAALVFFAPAVGTLVLWAFIVACALAFGPSLIAFGFELRRAGGPGTMVEV